LDLKVLDEAGGVVGQAWVGGREHVSFDLPVPAVERAVFRLRADCGWDCVLGDDRVLSFRVFSFDWDQP
jgi:hypothetical protein